MNVFKCISVSVKFAEESCLAKKLVQIFEMTPKLIKIANRGTPRATFIY